MGKLDGASYRTTDAPDGDGMEELVAALGQFELMLAAVDVFEQAPLAVWLSTAGHKSRPVDRPRPQRTDVEAAAAKDGLHRDVVVAHFGAICRPKFAGGLHARWHRSVLPGVR